MSADFYKLFYLLLLSSGLVCGQNDNEISLPKNKKSILTIKKKEINREKKEIDKAFELLNGSNNDSIVKVAHGLLKTVKTSYAKVNANLLLAYYYKNKTLIDSSNFYVEKSLKIKTIGTDSLDSRRRSIAYNILAINKKNQGLYEDSKKWHLRGLSETEKFGETDLYFTHLHGLALTSSKVKDYDRALELFKECLTYDGDPEIIYGSYINIAGIYAELDNLSLSNNYLNQAMQLASKNNDIYAKSIILLNLGDNYELANENKKAVDSYQKVIKIADENDRSRIGLIARKSLAKIFIKINRLSDAKMLLSSSLQKSQEAGLLSEQMEVYEDLKKIAILDADYKSALHLATQYFKIKDSINQLQKDEEIAELEIKFKTLQKEKEIKLLLTQKYNKDLELKSQKEILKNLKLEQDIINKSNENKILENKNINDKIKNENLLLKKDTELKKAQVLKEQAVKKTILYSFIAILLPIIALLIIYYQKGKTQKKLNKTQKEINQQKITSLLKDQELIAVKASVEAQGKERKRIAQELHDSIGGNLSAIKLQLNHQIDNSNSDLLQAINTQIDDTYNQVRNISHTLILDKLNENSFTDILKEYLNNIGNASKLKTSLFCYPAQKIDDLNEKMHSEIFKIIQELITNTVKYARAKSMELQLNLVDQSLNMLFEDDGIGFDVSKNRFGIGLDNIKNRLATMNGKLNIDSRLNRGTIIDITIPTNLIPTKYEI